MKIRMWGVRGSIPSPGPHTARYGGNTTCIEVRGDDDSLIILDAGTGIFPLAQSLLARLPVTANVFITHTHWDHIQGLPFFVPLYIPGNKVRIHGAYDIVNSLGIEQVMEVQMQYSYFPIREDQVRDNIEYQTLTFGEPVAIGAATVTPVLMNHPVTDLGYRVHKHSFIPAILSASSDCDNTIAKVIKNFPNLKWDASSYWLTIPKD